jgi:hypothetical protein
MSDDTIARTSNPNLTPYDMGPWGEWYQRKEVDAEIERLTRERDQALAISLKVAAERRAAHETPEQHSPKSFVEGYINAADHLLIHGDAAVFKTARRYRDEANALKACELPHLDTCGLKYGGPKCTCGLES